MSKTLVVALLAIAAAIAALVFSRGDGNRSLSPEKGNAGAFVPLDASTLSAHDAAGMAHLASDERPDAAPDAAARVAPPPTKRHVDSAREPGQRAVLEALRAQSPSEASLYAQIERAGAEAPAEAAALIEKARAGASRDELEASVRASFPRDARARVAAIKWIHEQRPAPAPPLPKGMPLRGGKIQRSSAP